MATELVGKIRGTDVSLYGFFVLFISFILIPAAKFSEEEINGKLVLSYEQIQGDIQLVRKLVAEPIAQDPIRYFEILSFLRETEDQCKLFLHSIKGAPVLPPDMNDCHHFQGQTSWYMNDLFNKYHRGGVTNKNMDARNRYTALHPGWDEIDRISNTIYHPDQAWLAFTNGLLLSILFFLARLFQKEFNIYLELCNPRFWMAVISWPIAIFIYPNDPVRQFKDLAKSFGYLLMTTVSCFGAGIVKAAEKTTKSKGRSEKSSLSVSGYVQGIMDGDGQNRFREGNIRLITNGKLDENWSGRLELGLTNL